MKLFAFIIVTLLSGIAQASEWDMGSAASNWDMSGAPVAVASSWDMCPAEEKVAVVAKPAAIGYPVRGGHWSVLGNHSPARQNVINHLESHGEHAGKFDRAWLETLNLEQLRSLHDDDHEHRYRGQVVRATTKTQPVYRQVAYYQPVQSKCPGGYCPRR